MKRLVSALTLLPSAALAHPGDHRTSGLWHVLTEPDHHAMIGLAVAVLGITIVVSAAFVMMALTDFEFDQVLFETVSAFATVGLSTGITPMLPDSAQGLVIALMFIGRLGPLTVATGFAMRERTSRRRLPEERMTIG